ncbi:MAG: HD domain-containing protein [Lachnospiraceae bacterium]|nr:HD domain-containing protein [Lachnospiraceae bacterium]
MLIPSLEKAEQYLNWAGQCNPGVWVDHSRVVAKAAGKIAEVCGLHPETAQIVGLLHDLGRYKGVTSMMHIYDGYQILSKDGYADAAQICITHSFPIQDIHVYSGENDCPKAIYQEITEILSAAQYTDYDRLIQLCDSLALPQGICLLEKRLLDVALRHGVNSYTIPKWESVFGLWDYFCKMGNMNLYDLFDEVNDITFNKR